MPDTTVNGQTFTYGEQSFGKNRGIMMFRPGVAKDRHEYKFDPDPHDEDKSYNKKQAEFYLSAAEAIAVQVNGNNWPVPDRSTIEVNGHTYTLGSR